MSRNATAAVKAKPADARSAETKPVVAKSVDPLAKYARLEAFTRTLWGHVYPEVPTRLHADIVDRVYRRVKETFPLPKGARVLDIGCGQGVALKHFAADELNATGIALGEDVEICRKLGYDAVEMDLSFLDFPDQTFDLVWCRHAIEHSFMPMFVLSEIHRVLKPGGVVYVEVPSPNTASNHESNPNHYSVLGQRMWLQLIQRSGFVSLSHFDISFPLKIGPDTYMGFTARRASA